jgi:hypothetical protein
VWHTAELRAAGPRPGARDAGFACRDLRFVPGFCRDSDRNQEQIKPAAACRRRAGQSGEAHYTIKLAIRAADGADSVRDTPGTANLKTGALITR